MTNADRIIPSLQELTVPPSQFARMTCFQGGFLVSKNSGWRSERPVIDHDSCTLCLQCYMLCPDGTIFKQRDGANVEAIDVDLDFCKGCGICAKACPTSCIEMVLEVAFLNGDDEIGATGQAGQADAPGTPADTAKTASDPGMEASR